MLIMAAALVSLSACSKSASEPVVQKQNAETGEDTVITVNIEGEREDVVVVDDESARALDVKGTATGNKLTGVSFGDGPREVDGVIYFYKGSKMNNIKDTPGYVYRAKFQVNGKKIRHTGSYRLKGYPKGALVYTMMDVYVGGNIAAHSFDANGESSSNEVDYLYQGLALRTQDGMDLSRFNPIFYSTGNTVTVGDKTKGQDKDYYDNDLRFRLYGDFVSFRFRMVTGAGVTAKYNGVSVRGFGTGGLTLKKPTDKSYYRPYMVSHLPSSNSANGVFIGFSDGLLHTIKGDGQPPVATTPSGAIDTDAAYTLYLFPAVENKGGVRMAYTRASNSIFVNGGNGLLNYPNYWGTYTAGRLTPYERQSSRTGAFHNLVMGLRAKR